VKFSYCISILEYKKVGAAKHKLNANIYQISLKYLKILLFLVTNNVDTQNKIDTQ